MPGPIDVLRAIPKAVSRPNYWVSWVSSSQRVFLGFFIAALLAIALGIALGMSKKFRDLAFPILEIFRPIPPLGWLPLSILFWPSSEMTIVFLTFMGAFFPILLNVISGIDNIDIRYVHAAMSLGSNRRALFWSVLMPGALPSLFTGLTMAIGITWEVVIAAEMAASNNGLGYLTWDAYMSQSLVGIILGMVSIGVAGMISSWIMNWFGSVVTPWRRNG